MYVITINTKRNLYGYLMAECFVYCLNHQTSIWLRFVKCSEGNINQGWDLQRSQTREHANKLLLIATKLAFVPFGGSIATCSPLASVELFGYVSLLILTAVHQNVNLPNISASRWCSLYTAPSLRRGDFVSKSRCKDNHYNNTLQIFLKKI